MLSTPSTPFGNYGVQSLTFASGSLQTPVDSVPVFAELSKYYLLELMLIDRIDNLKNVLVHNETDMEKTPSTISSGNPEFSRSPTTCGNNGSGSLQARAKELGEFLIKIVETMVADKTYPKIKATVTMFVNKYNNEIESFRSRALRDIVENSMITGGFSGSRKSPEGVWSDHLANKPRAGTVVE